MPGRMVSFRANGRSASGYLAAPASGKGPGVLVLQEYWGLVDHIKEVAERFARMGFVALAPDLFDGDSTRHPDEALRKLMALNIAETSKELRAAAEYLRGLPEVEPKNVAAVGFCMGGQLALLAATEHPDEIAAAVDFYGIHPNVKPDFSKLQGKVLAHFGLHDDFVPEADARALVAQIQAAGKSVEAHFYDAGHAFFNDDRPEVYSMRDAETAWERTIAFLKAKLA